MPTLNNAQDSEQTRKNVRLYCETLHIFHTPGKYLHLPVLIQLGKNQNG
ncbi:hypothetical protein GPLA_4021 [Paraglaciecola polaris LMG 21857]|uniref:Uncharacterized protein n=1 Tax=Paraglaciecola polaris LMG 21857 TaxID=1129793 RepID=K7AI26_9ALTE|nr:hypothetical protein GPLA_4021 [Paraglaciecola polaris LMG 21857]